VGVSLGQAKRLDVQTPPATESFARTRKWRKSSADSPDSGYREGLPAKAARGQNVPPLARISEDTSHEIGFALSNVEGNVARMRAPKVREFQNKF
jgi:hypothetical protein